MMYYGGLQDKIKVINVIKNILDIQTSNLFEIEIKFEDHPSKLQFMQIAEKLQRIPFIYETINKNLSNTLLLRNLLYNPAVYPIIINKNECKGTECIYTRTPIRKYIIDKKFNILCVPPEEQLYVIGVAIDINKQGTIELEHKQRKDKVPEYLDFFENNNNLAYIYFYDLDINLILVNLIKQLRYTIRFYNSTIFLNTIDEFIKSKKITSVPNNTTINIKPWYSKKEIDYIKYLIKDKRDWVYNLDPLYTLGSNLDQLLYILTEGPKSEHVKTFFILNEMSTNKLLEIQKIEKKALENINIARQYIIIIAKKLGNNVQQKVLLSLSKGKYLRLPGGSMAVPSIVTNITDHLSILKHLTKEQQELVKVEYNRKDKYMKEFYNNKCEHLLIYKKLIRSRHINDTISNLDELSKFFNSNISNGYYTCNTCKFQIICSHVYNRYKYQIENISLEAMNTKLLEYAIMIKVNKGHEYYCKYCGEQLVKDIYIDDEIKVKQKFTISEVDLELRGFIWSVIMTIIHSAGLGNEKALAIYISNTVYPLIKTKFKDQLDDDIKFTSINYVFAMVLSIMKNSKISFLGIDINTQASKMAEKLLTFMYKKYNTIMQTLNVNTDIIKNEFTSAYKNIINIGPVELPMTNSEADLANFILNIDPIYNYAKNICKLFKKVPFDNDKSPQLLRKELEIILGTTLPNIIKLAKENIKNPKYVDIINKKFGSIIQLESLEYFHKDPDLNIYNNLITIDDDESILQKFLNGQHNLYIFASYIMLYKYVKYVHNEEDYKEFYDLLIKFRNVEERIKIDKIIYSKKPYYDMKYKKNSHFIKRNVNITELYDENGNKHKWNVFYYGTEKFKDIPLTKKTTLTDIECSVCGIKKSQLKTLNIEKTFTSVQSMSDLHSLYTFYKVRCPVSELHNWISDMCTKCTLTYVMVNNVSINKINEEILNYYNKYLSEFNREKSEIKIDIAVTKKEEKITNYIKQNWVHNYTPVVKVSQLTNIQTVLLESIGLTEEKTYKEIENGELPEIELHHLYNTLSELIYVIDKSQEFYNKLGKTVNVDYTDIFNQLLYEKSYHEIHKFIIQSICEIILLLVEDNKQYAIDLINVVIKNQRLLSIPIISMAVDESDDVVYLGDDIGDSGEDLIIYQKVEDNYSSIKNIDYNGINESHIEPEKMYIYNNLEIV